jgi:nucleotide-binding universal stress UspA family protein
MPDTDRHPPFSKGVLGLNGGPTDELVAHVACQLAKPSGASLVAVHVIEVDWTRELSDDVASEDEQASAILDAAELIAEGYGVPLTADLLQARDVGAALVDEAIELGADAILVGLPYRKRLGGDFALGLTLPYILQNAPSQVIVVREPVATSEERRATAAPPAAGGTFSLPRLVSSRLGGRE